MTELRNETLNLVKSFPEEYLSEIFSVLKNIVDKKNSEKEDTKLKIWQNEPEKYNDEINDWVNNFVKKSRLKNRGLNNANNY